MRHALKSAVAALCLVAASSAVAQPLGFDVEKKDKTEKLQPPTLNQSAGDTGETWIMIGAVIMVLLAVTANLIPSKRGHQD